MTDNWFWVRDGATSADPQEIAGAATRYSWAHDNVRNARAALWATDSKLGLNLVVPLTNPVRAPEHLEALSDLALQIRQVLERIEHALTVLSGKLKLHAEHLGMTALVYSSAEGDAAAHIRTCNTLASVGCFARSEGFSVATLLMAMPRYVGGMFGSDGNRSVGSPFSNPQIPGTSGVEAQHQVATIAGRTGVDEAGRSGVPALSARMAGLWKTLGFPPWAGASGVVVSGGAGALWGGLNPHPYGSGIKRVSLDRPGAVSAGSPPTAWRSDSHPVQKGLRATGSARVVAVPTPLRELPGRLGFKGVATPRTAGQLLARIPLSSSPGGAGQIQILRHVNTASGKRSWSVVLAGTQQWLPRTLNPQDMNSNFQEIAGQTSDQHISVRLAMELAGIKPGEPVEFVGHSQGGAVALSVAADAEATNEYRVVSVLTAGAPNGPSAPKDVPVLALENLTDLVPALDGRSAPVGEGQQVIHFDAAALDQSKVEGAHSMETYIEAANQLGARAQSDPALSSYLKWEAGRKVALGLDRSTVTEPLYFTTTRVSGTVDESSVRPTGLPGVKGVGVRGHTPFASVT